MFLECKLFCLNQIFQMQPCQSTICMFGHIQGAKQVLYTCKSDSKRKLVTFHHIEGSTDSKIRRPTGPISKIFLVLDFLNFSGSGSIRSGPRTRIESVSPGPTDFGLWIPDHIKTSSTTL